MKICIITQQYRNIHSGIGLYATNIIKYLSNLGHQITVICSPDCRIDKTKNIRFIKVKNYRFDPTPNKWVSFSYYVSKYLKNKNNFDIIHFSDAREALFIKNNNVKLIGNMNDFYTADAKINPLYYYNNFPNDWIFRWLYYNVAKNIEKISLSKLDKIICNTNFVRDIIYRKYQIDHKKLLVIYKSINLTNFKNNYKKIDFDNYPVLLFIGGNFQRKGIYTILKSIREIKNRYPKIILVVIGKDKKCIRKINKQYKDLKNNIKFLGKIPNNEIIKYYNSATIYVMPSLFEAFGVTYLEAMASGLPTIGGVNGGTKELIIDHENGFLVDANDHERLSEIIINIAEDRKLRRKIIKNGYKTANKFTLNYMMKKTMSEYLR